ncbi:MAG TPA: AI-2E family transporter [Gemmatimonadales bacterium]|nr:AI-2E family transporter [Gemmatimonadales bacterium]
MTDNGPAVRRAAPLLLVLGVAALGIFLLEITELVLVGFIAALLSVYLGGFTDLLVRRFRLPRGVGLALALLLTLAGLTGIGALLAPAVIQQTQDLIAAVPRYLNDLDEQLRRLASRYPILTRTGIASQETGLVSSALAEIYAYVRRSFFAYATATGRILIDSVAVIVMALYLAMKPRLYHAGLVQLVPPQHRKVAQDILQDLVETLRSWVGAQLLAMVVLAALTGIGLWILNVPFWLAFAIFTGVAVMVPFFGTIVSTLLPALLVLGDRGWLAFIAVAMVGVIVHLVEANIVHPLIMQHRVALPPVLTILSVLVMAKIGGILGMVVAVPALATAFVLVRHLVIYQTYGERPEAESPPPAVLQPTKTGKAVAR